jgi:hypothetical protein
MNAICEPRPSTAYNSVYSSLHRGVFILTVEYRQILDMLQRDWDSLARELDYDYDIEPFTVKFLEQRADRTASPQPLRYYNV